MNETITYLGPDSPNNNELLGGNSEANLSPNMSYLPRMSKTYREPEERTQEEPTREITFNSIPIASAQPDVKAYNPQSVLKQYSYYPHPPPVLPGPSLLQEAEENEKIIIEAKKRRSREESEANVSVSNINNSEEKPVDSPSQNPTVNFALLEVKTAKAVHEEPAPNSSRKVTKSIKTPKKGLTKVNKNKEETIKAAKSPANNEIVEAESKSPQKLQHDHFYKNEIAFPRMIENPVRHRSNLKSDQKIPIDTGEKEVLASVSVKGSVHEGVQCSPTSGSEKIFVMPSCIHYLLRTLSFLVQELDTSESDGKPEATKEIKKLLNQINEAVNSLSNRKIDSNVALQTSFSDRKRLEKIYTDLEQYIQDVYGENGKLGCKSEEKKNLYCKLLQKEYELNVLNEKLRQSEIQNPSLKQVELMTKPPEVVLQNKNLENEQLRAEVEFNSQELKKFHQTLAEKNWEIHNNKEEISALKKKLAALKSKTKK